MCRLDEDLIPFIQRELEPRLRSPWEPGEVTISRLLRPELVDSAKTQEVSESAVSKDTAALDSSSTVNTYACVPPSIPSLLVREEQQGPSGRWRDTAAQRAPGSLTRRQGYDSGPRERFDRSSLDRERIFESPTAVRNYRSPTMGSSGKPGENGSLASRVNRTSLAGGAPYGSFCSELVDPILFPPAPSTQEYQQPMHPAPPAPAASEQVQEVAATAPSTVIIDPADDRDEFEKELDAVVAELEKVCLDVAIV